MELRRFRYFVAVVEQGGFTRAAEMLPMSQPALSQQIRILEREVGVPLLERGPGGATPTPAGLAFYERIRDVLTAVEAARGAAHRAAAEAETLRIGLSHPLPAEVDVLAISAFKAAHPYVRVTWHELTLASFDGPLLDGEVDVALLRTPLDPERLVWDDLVRGEPRAIAVPHGHPLWDAEEALLADVLDAPMAAVADHVPGMMRRYWHLYDERGGERPRFVGEPTDRHADLVLSVRLNGTLCPGPFAFGRSLPLSGLKVLPMPELPCPVTVAARRRDDPRPLPEIFCRLAAQAVRAVQAP
ncbi:LysR family transcriptional regulator [Spirillospora sp. NPDC050679]